MDHTFPNLKRAPIAEAIIDLRVEAPGLDLEKVASVYSGVQDHFPERHDRVEAAELFK